METTTTETMELLEERQRPLTVDEYRAMARAGILRADDRVELIDGRIISMSPIGWPHANIVVALSDLLWRASSYQVSVQNPLGLDRYNEPQPDIALLRRDRDPAGPIASEHAALVVEVSDTSLAYDRRLKLPRYAKAGIPVVWIVDVEGRCVEAYEEPDGETYRQRIVLHPGDEIDVPGARAVPVGDIFP